MEASLEKDKPISFLIEMPPEIRNLIYEQLIATLSSIDVLDHHAVHAALSLAHTCVALRKEFTPIFHSHAHLTSTVLDFNFDKVARYSKRLPDSTLQLLRLNEHLVMQLGFSRPPYQCAGGLTRWALHRIHAASNGRALRWRYVAEKHLVDAGMNVDRSVFRNWYKNSWDPRVKPELGRLLMALELI